MARTYDKSIVANIQPRVRYIQEDGLDIELRPIPDDDREHVLDPRVLELTLKKMGGAVRVVAMDDVISMRSRPNKETYPIDDEDGVVETRQIVRFADRGIPIHMWRPAASEADVLPLIYFIHGGGFTSGIVAGYVNAMRRLCQVTGCAVVYPEYRLAPENPFPAAPQDCADVLRWLADHAKELAIDISKLAIGGDSAGGSLTNATVLTCQDEIPASLVFDIFPCTDCDPATRLDGFSYDCYPVIEEQAEPARMRVDRIKDSKVDILYALYDEATLCDPLISAMKATDEQLSCFPRTLMIDSEYDFLRIQDEAFARRLAGLGVDVRTIRYLGCDHGWFEAAGTMPQVEDLCNLLASELEHVFA